MTYSPGMNQPSNPFLSSLHQTALGHPPPDLDTRLQLYLAGPERHSQGFQDALSKQRPDVLEACQEVVGAVHRHFEDCARLGRELRRQTQFSLAAQLAQANSALQLALAASREERGFVVGLKW